jgi:hypothetical protein
VHTSTQSQLAPTRPAPEVNEVAVLYCMLAFVDSFGGVQGFSAESWAEADFARDCSGNHDAQGCFLEVPVHERPVPSYLRLSKSQLGLPPYSGGFRG